MDVPLIQRRVLSYGSGLRINSGSPLAQSTSGYSLRLAGLRIDTSRSDDAVKVSLSSESKNLNSASRSEELQLAAPKIQGYAQGVLAELGKITEQIGELNNRISSELLDPHLRESLTQEFNLLTQEYDRVVQSDDFKRLFEVSSGVEGAISGGATGAALFNSLQTHRALLGEDYLDLVSGFALGNIQQFNSSLGALGSIRGEDLRNSPELVGQLKDAIKRASDALKAPTALQPQTVETAEQKTVRLIDPPQISEMQFAYNENLAVSLRGYSGKDLLTAALTGIVSDPKKVNQLVVDLPRYGEDKEDEEEERQKKVEESKLTPISIDEAG